MKDLVVIGGGPGGYIAAIRARQLGLDVTLIEKDAVGGTCLNRGCIPTKAYFKNAGVIKTITESQEYGVEVSQLNFDMATAKARKDKVVSSLVSGIKQLLLANGVEIIKGEASLVDKNTILVDGQELKTEKILLATGSVPSLLPIKGIELEGVMTSDDILELSEVPKRLVIISVIYCD
ncbi:MAG: FAD-dependent oxidoreductase [Syntrophomonadaceae bacterium]|nr:FAD-dependent oxidoreductase [Syntrophomonadaceae bacterium]